MNKQVSYAYQHLSRTETLFKGENKNINISVSKNSPVNASLSLDGYKHSMVQIIALTIALKMKTVIVNPHHCNNSVFPGAKNLPENQAIFEYYDLMLQSISSYSFQAMAHLDFPRRYFDSWEIPEKTINSILELMIKKEILLEINTSSISNDCTEPLPSYNIIKKYIELGGKKVVLGSDAHNCSFLGNGYDCIRKNLPLELEIGYFKNREFVGINSNTFE